MVYRSSFLHLENRIVRLQVRTQHWSDTALRRHDDEMLV